MFGLRLYVRWRKQPIVLETLHPSRALLSLATLPSMVALTIRLINCPGLLLDSNSPALLYSQAPGCSL